MFKRFFSTAKQSTAHLRKYNPFVEFKSDLHRSMDQHIQSTNTILNVHTGLMIAGFTALYTKTESDKKDLNTKIDTNKDELNKRIDNLDHRMDHLEHRMDHLDKRMDNIEQKLAEMLTIMNTRRGWFW